MGAVGRNIGKGTTGKVSYLQDVDLGLKTIQLPSGKTVDFIAYHINANDVKKNTVVHSEINGRDQSVLTPSSVSKITETIKHHQWFPVIGKFADDGQLEILDGSRRRLSVIEAKVGLDVLVAEDSDITVEDAKAISRQIQTAREHSIRDLGIQILPLFEEQQMKQAEIAERTGYSVSKVNRAISAARVPTEMLTLFPDPNELSIANYKQLLNMSEVLEGKKQTSTEDLIELVKMSIEEEKNDSLLPDDELKSQVMHFYTEHFNDLIKKKKPARVNTTKLLEFDDKNKFARKKVQGSTKWSYEFSRLGKDVQKEIDAAIKGVLDNHFEAS